MPTPQNITKSTMQAARDYNALQAREQNPAGRFNRQKRWYPTQAQECCASVHQPTDRYPYSLMLHCRSAKHIGQQYGVDPSLVRLVARQMKED